MPGSASRWSAVDDLHSTAERQLSPAQRGAAEDRYCHRLAALRALAHGETLSGDVLIVATPAVYCATQPPSMFHAAPRTRRRRRCTETAPFRPAAAGDKLPGGLFFRQQLRAGLLRVDPFGDALIDLLLHQRVSTQPGQMALQVMPLRAVSRATVLVRPTTACLAAT